MPEPAMPEPATTADTHARYVELISDSLLMVGEAIHVCATAEHALEVARANQAQVPPEVVSSAARAFRSAQEEMKKSIDQHGRLCKSYVDFQAKC